jgi:hypothetical protein
MLSAAALAPHLVLRLQLLHLLAQLLPRPLLLSEL